MPRASAEAPLVVALDGRSGAGKSTLARTLAAALDGVVVEGDDFYSGGTIEEWEGRSAAENAARCIDWRRLRAEALEPLAAGRPARWLPFDWDAGDGLASRAVVAEPRPVVVVDGVYSGRPELADLIGLALLVTVDEDVRTQRLHARDAQARDERWQAVWDEAERHYFSEVVSPDRFDVIVERG